MPARPLSRSGLVLAVGAGVGVLAELAAYDVREVDAWGPDLLTGLAFVVAAASVVTRRARLAVLLLAVALTWFAGTVAPPLLHLHRGPLIHLLLAGSGRRPTRLATAAIALGYAASLAPTVWRDDRFAVALGAGLVALAAWDWAVSRGRTRSDRRWSLLAIGAFVAAIAGGALARRAFPLEQSAPAALLAYDLVLIGLAVAVAARARPRADVDLLVEWGDTPAETLRDALARTLQDSLLQVGYWSGDGYRDETGTVVAAPTGPDREATFVQETGRPLAILVHDASVLDDPGMVDAVAAATRLSVAHDRLTAEANRHLADVERSRRRLLVAADEARRGLESRLDDVVIGPLSGLLADLSGIPAGNPHVQQAARHLSESLEELRSIARGLYPRGLDAGLDTAIVELAERASVPVRVEVDDGQHPVPRDIAVAAYYVAAEAMSNVMKHARGRRARLSVHRSATEVVVEVSDDGRGGARVRPGSGLAGLRDRVEAVGGTVTVLSPHGAGTRITAQFPLGGDAP